MLLSVCILQKKTESTIVLQFHQKASASFIPNSSLVIFNKHSMRSALVDMHYS